jgi:sporulation protein YlmC with PRC-barrel domain
MEERGLVGLEARATDGEILGRISALITDERSGEVTHVIVERGEESR